MTTDEQEPDDRLTFRLTLRPLPRPDDPRGVRRLRAGLKALLRSFGLRCVSVVPNVDSGDVEHDNKEECP